MADFNLQTLYDFQPARFRCEKCSALLVDAPMPIEGHNPRCPVCLVEYVPDKRYSRFSVGNYLTAHGCDIKFEDLLQHCKDLAEAMQAQDFFLVAKPPLHLLLAALSRAEQFVHFMSFGISEFFIGVLKLSAQRVSVRGIVSNVDERVLDEVTSFKNDVPFGGIEINHYLRGEAWDDAARSAKGRQGARSCGTRDERE